MSAAEDLPRGKKLRLGYFIPEFPGQTHIFFWREKQRLEALHADVRIVSTRPAPLRIASHSWSDQARAEARYLYDQSLFPLACELFLSALCFSPRAWLRVLKSIKDSAQGLSHAGTLFLCALLGARLACIAAKEQWEHLHVHSAANSANIALFASLLSGLPYSLTLHGPLKDYGQNQSSKWANAKFGIVITEKLKKELLSELGPELEPKLSIAPMGVNLSVFQRKNEYRTWDGQGPVRIYSVGRLNVCKGHNFLIEAVDLLRSRGYTVELKIAGEDELGGKGYRQDLEAQVADLKLRREVKLLGAVSEETVRQGLEDSHIFALASLHEPLGVAIMEAMALEMPVVVTGAGGVKELVDHQIDGALVEPSDALGLANAIEEILKKPELAQRLSHASRKKIEANFQDTRSAEVLLQGIKNSL